jgi:hypothetical protein
MTDTNDTAVRAALLQLGARSSAAADLSFPLLLRAPAIALLWATLVVVLVSLLALSRIRLPHTARGVAVSVHTGADSATLMMLLPAAVQPYVRPGQQATLDVGNARPLVLDVAHVDSALLDASGARRRFPHASQLLAHLDAPKVAVTLAPCAATPACLTPSVGSVYAATASLGTRSLASYAWSGTPPPAR